MLNLILLVLSGPAFSAPLLIDLQFSVCERHPEALAEQLDFRKDPKEGLISYFEDGRGTFARGGLFLKVKQRKGTFATEVKVSRGPVAGAGPDCQMDQYGQHREIKCALKNKSSGLEWTVEQKRLAAEKGDVDWKHLPVLGPFQETSWKGVWGDAEDIEAGFDILYLPGRNEPVTEFSVKVTAREAEKWQRNITARFENNRVKLCPVQEGKVFRVLRAGVL